MFIWKVSSPVLMVGSSEVVVKSTIIINKIASKQKTWKETKKNLPGGEMCLFDMSRTLFLWVESLSH